MRRASLFLLVVGLAVLAAGAVTADTPPAFLLKWGGMGDGRFHYPHGVAVDSSGNAYVADTENHRIQKFNSSGVFLAKWGSGGSADGQFDSPEGVAVDSSGNVYVADTWNHRIQKFGLAFQTTGGFVKAVRWNLVSVPADPIPADPATLLAGIDVPNANLQFWKNATSDVCQLYGEDWGWTGPIVRGTPYWFIETAAGSDKDLSFYGLAPTADFELTISGHTTAPFWIMLGTPFTNPVLADNTQFKNITKRGDTWLSWVDAYSDSDPTLRIVESNAQGWDAVAQGFFTVAPTAWFGRHQFYPWYGYWMMICGPNETKIKFPKP